MAKKSMINRELKRLRTAEKYAAKRAELAAVVELARRSLQQRLADRPAFDSPQAVRDYLQLQLAAR